LRTRTARCAFLSARPPRAKCQRACDGRILPLCEDTLLQWRLIIESGRKRGQTISHPDLLIGASAARHGLTVVTRDTDDFEAAGVAVFNPWRKSA